MTEPDMGGVLVAPSTTKESASSKAIVRNKTRARNDLGWALLYMAPALLLFLAFTFVPFLRSIQMSFYVTDQTGNLARFNGINYYTRILNLDGSGRTEYLASIVTTF